MRYLPVLFVLFIALMPAIADQPGHYCNDPEINQQWDQALQRYPDDPLVLKLAARRGVLCGQLAARQIDAEQARDLWEDALLTALLERARVEQEQRGLLKLFGTF